MIELTLLGLQTVRDADGREIASLAAQPKRFALLAYLAVSGSGGFHRRDTLAAMFWPDLDQFAARRALRNTLYHLRETIGDGVLITQGDDALAIDPARLTCDVTKLSAAVAEGRLEEAVELFRGELMAGLHFANAGEVFEEWLARERARVVALVNRATRALVDREAKAGNLAAAAHWAQRACALSPDDEPFLRRAMALHDAADDRGGALRLYDAYARHISVDFDAKPSAESARLATQIRAGAPMTAVRGAPPAAAASASIAATTSVPDTIARSELDPGAAVEPSVVPGPHPLSSERKRRLAPWAFALAAAAVAGFLITRAVSASRPHPIAKARVLVDVFENRTDDPNFDALGRMAEDWLSQGLLRTALVDVVDSRVVFVQGHAPNGTAVDPVTLARKSGAAFVVTGSYYRLGDSVIFQASVVDARSGRTVRVVGPVAAEQHATVNALDELRSRVMTALASVVDLRDSPDFEKGGEIPPFEAYQAYVEGWDAYWHGDVERAESLFVEAVHRDTAFFSAAVAAATVASNRNECSFIDSVERSLNPALRKIDRIERLSLQIAVMRCRGRNEEMLRLTLERAELAPGTSSLRISAAAAALWADRPQKALDLLERIDPSLDLSWSSDSTHFAYWSDLTEALHMLGRHREELSAADRMTLAAPLTRTWLRGRALAALGRPAELLSLIDSSLSLPVETANSIGLAPYSNGRPEYSATPAWIAVWLARELAVHGDTATSRAAATRALAWYRARTTEERATPEEQLVAIWSLDLMGSYAEAERDLRTLMAADTSNVDYRGVLGGLAAERSDVALTDSVDRWLALQKRDEVGWSASYYRARNDALIGRREDAVAREREARDKGVWPMMLHADPALTARH